MPRARKEPTYLLHKPSGQARTRVDGEYVYLGKHSPDHTGPSWETFLEIRRQWRLRQDVHKRRDGKRIKYPLLTLDQLAERFIDWADVHYRDKFGEPTGEAGNIRYALRPLLKLFGPELVAEFDITKLEAYRDELIRRGRCRTSINRDVHRVRHLFAWALPKKLAGRRGGNLYGELLALETLQPNRTKAHENPEVDPVPMPVVRATYRKLSRVLRDMVHVQLLTAMRPGEVCLMRPCDITKQADGTWLYQPMRHKTQWRNKLRLVSIGPRGQRILAKYLKGRGPETFIFTPGEAMSILNRERKRRRKTPLTPSQRSRGFRAPGRDYSDRYTADSYGKAVRRAARAAKVQEWGPNRLRHTRATELARENGIEKTAVVLGHSDIRSTQRYAKKEAATAAALMRQLG
jgi:integrase